MLNFAYNFNLNFGLEIPTFILENNNKISGTNNKKTAKTTNNVRMDSRSNRETICGNSVRRGKIYPDSMSQVKEVEIVVFNGVAKKDIYKCFKIDKNQKKTCNKGDNVHVIGDFLMHPDHVNNADETFLIFTNKGMILRDRNFINEHVEIRDSSKMTMTSNESGKDTNKRPYRKVFLLNNQNLRVWIKTENNEEIIVKKEIEVKEEEEEEEDGHYEYDSTGNNEFRPGETPFYDGQYRNNAQQQQQQQQNYSPYPNDQQGFYGGGGGYPGFYYAQEQQLQQLQQQQQQRYEHEHEQDHQLEGGNGYGYGQNYFNQMPWYSQQHCYFILPF